MWVDFREIRDAFMRARGIDYFENSRRATLIQQQYAVHNPLEYEQYGEQIWGFTASDGPGWTARRIKGIGREFHGYYARGAPYGPDDGTVAPWGVMSSLPFAPEIVVATLRSFRKHFPSTMGNYSLKCSFNATFNADAPDVPSWTSRFYYGIDLGPIVLMTENHRTGRPWKVMQRCAPVVDGLRKAGFRGGWLDGA
jgi:hypothetical protein